MAPPPPSDNGAGAARPGVVGVAVISPKLVTMQTRALRRVRAEVLSLPRDRSVQQFAVIAFMFFFPLSSRLSGSLVVSLGKQATTVLLLLVCVHTLLYLPGIRSSTIPRRLWVYLWLYSAIILISSMINGRTSRELFEYATLPISVLALYVCERTRPGSFFRALYIAGCLHLVLAVITNDRSVDETSGAARLAGLSHPITLGVEAGVIFLCALCRIFAARVDRVLEIGLMILALYVLWEAFSKTAIIAVMASTVLVVAFHEREGMSTRAIWTFAVAGTVLSLSWAQIATTLVGGERGLEVFATGTGRTNIWEAIYATFSEYWMLGYGWAPLHSPGGPDAHLYALTGGLGAENSFVASLLMGGLTTGVLYVLFWGYLTRFAMQTTVATHGLSLGLLSLLFVAASLVDSLAGLSYLWWWLLGLVSIAHRAVRKLERAPSST